MRASYPSIRRQREQVKSRTLVYVRRAVVALPAQVVQSPPRGRLSTRFARAGLVHIRREQHVSRDRCVALGAIIRIATENRQKSDLKTRRRSERDRARYWVPPFAFPLTRTSKADVSVCTR